MSRFGVPFSLVVLVVAAGCGSNSRQLQSINISPAIADAQDFPDGQVQFVPTGHYTQAPVTLSPLPVLWAIYLPGGKNGATITQSGIAQCEAGVSSTFSVLAYAPTNPSIPIAKLETANSAVVGTATLTCP
jgi:hypothetical protein